MPGLTLLKTTNVSHLNNLIIEKTANVFDDINMTII